MSSHQRIVITSNGTLADFNSLCDLTPGNQPAMISFQNYINGITSGSIPGALMHFKIGALKASGTITFASFAADDTITIAGVTLTAKASGASGPQFNIGVSPTDNGTAAAAAAKINSYASFSGIVVATATLAVVTVTAEVPGLIGNAIGLAISAHGSASGALLTAGSDGTAYNIDLT